jgi:hypothetical protein
VRNGHPLLLAPLRYWSIQHPVKRQWDVVLPSIGAAGLTAALLLWPAIPSPYVSGGFLPSLQNLFAIMGGFFVSALTLISTSSAPGLLQPLSGTPSVRLPGQRAPLTRQRFLSLLFGYLAFSAFALYAIGFSAMLIAPGMKSLLPTILHIWASALFLLLYDFWLSHVFITTLVGLYYFTDRLARPDPEITRG